MSQYFISTNQSVCILKRSLSGWDKGWHRVCHCQMAFWKGLELNSCAQTLANKKQAIRLKTPGVRVFTPLLLILIWSSSEPPGWLIRAFLGQFHLPTLSLFRHLLGKKHTTVCNTSDVKSCWTVGRWRAKKRCFLPLKIWIPICPYFFVYCKLFWVWIISFHISLLVGMNLGKD